MAERSYLVAALRCAEHAVMSALDVTTAEYDTLVHEYLRAVAALRMWRRAHGRNR